MIEEHEHTDTTLDSYYPSKASTVYSVLSDFDKYGRLTKTDTIVENVYDVAPEYDSNGNLNVKGANGSAILATSKDLTNNQLSKYHYNKGQLESIETENSSGTVISEETFDYDDIGRLTKDTCVYDKANSKSIRTEILYEKAVDDPLADNKPNRYSHYLNNSSSPIAQTGYDFDDFNRIKTKFCSINGSEFTKNITYTKTRPTRLFEMLSGRPLCTTDYTYDNRGRIATVIADGTTIQYTYDQYGQLTEEKNVSLDKTIQYVYNGIGNISSVKTISSSGSTSTQSFTYGDTSNPDRLTAFGFKAITYNSMGCPTSYNGKNFTWIDGKLYSVSKGSGLGRAIISNRENYFYTYNAKGQRTHKDYSYLPADFSATYYYTRSINTEYAYDNAGRLIRERRTYTYSDNTSYSIEFMFLYDERGIVGVQFKDGDAAAKAYYYQRNLQGDVIAIYDTAGAVQAKYSYDAWGNCTVTNSTNSHLANYNPIRYRGYYWDSETNWYFLNARYYSPEWRRFISPDNTAYLDPNSINGLNLYAYCRNNPVMYIDPSGTDAVLITAYCAGGLPIVGHTALAVQDEYGNWFIVEYTGSGKENAKVKIKYLGKLDDIFSTIDSKYGKFTQDEINKESFWDAMLMKTKNFLSGSTPYETIYLEGDYSYVLKNKSVQQGNDLGGYHLITNNCAQFISNIMITDDSNLLMKIAHATLIPAIFHDRVQFNVNQSEFFYNTYNQITSFFSNLFN